MLPAASASSFSIAQASTISVSGLSESSKYNGMIELSKYKVARNRLFELISYVDTTFSNFLPMHMIVTFFRVLQIIGPSLYLNNYYTFWRQGDMIFQILSVFSVFFHLVPPVTREFAAAYMLYIYTGVNVLLFILLFAATMYFHKYAFIPNFAVNFIYIYISVVGYLFHPIGFEYIGEMVSYYCATKEAPIAEVVFIILSVICFLIYLWFYIVVASSTVIFRPSSFITVSSSMQRMLLIGTVLINLFSALSTNTFEKYSEIALTAVTAILYFLMVAYTIKFNSFVKHSDEILVMSSFSAGGMISIVSLIFKIMEKFADEVFFILAIAIFIINIVLFVFLTKWIHNRNLAFLDRIDDNNEVFQEVRSISKSEVLALEGMRVAHPVCLNWQFFRMAVDRWPESINCWFYYAKFIAIYPEEIQTLDLILKNIASKHISGSLAKQTCQQIVMLDRMRETNLSPTLKKKLDKLNKDVTLAKQRLRNVWDNVLQGNFTEMEGTIDRAIKITQKTKYDFNQLIQMYPNNRFSARAYARYLHDIESDQVQYSEWMEKIRSMQRGIQVTQDVAHELGMIYFPNLPNNVSALIKHGQTESESIESEIIEDDNFTEKGVEHCLPLRKKIESLSIPSVRCSILTTILFFVILVLIPAIVFLVYIAFYISSLSEPLNYLYIISYLRTLMFQSSTFIHHYVLENLFSDLINQTYFDPPDFSDLDLSSFNYANTTKEQLRFIAEAISTMNQEILEYSNYKPDDPYFYQVREIIFNDTIDYTEYSDSNGYVSKRSFVNAMSDYSYQISNLLAITIDNTTIETEAFLNAQLNIQVLGDQASDANQHILDYITNLDVNMKKIILFVEIAIIVFYFIILLIITIFEIRMFHKDQDVIFKCLAALPKNIVSQIAESLRILKKDDMSEESRSSVSLGNEGDVNKQEENILKIFATWTDSSSFQLGSSIAFIIVNILIFAMALVDVVLLCNLYTSETSLLKREAPHLDNILGSYGYMSAVILTINSIALSTMGERRVDPDPSPLYNKVQARTSQHEYYFHYAMYGQEDENEYPYEYISEAIDQYHQTSKCSQENQVQNTSHMVIECLSAEFQIILMATLARVFVEPFGRNNSVVLMTTDNYLTDIWYYGSVALYNGFYYPMFSSIVDQMSNTLNSNVSSSAPGIIICLVITFFVVLILILKAKSNESSMKYTLKLLLNAPVTTLYQSSKIMSVLSGEFHDKSLDSANRNTEFYKEVVESLPDAVAVLNKETNVVEQINKSFARYFGEDLLNTNLSTNSLFQGLFLMNVNNLLPAANETNENLEVTGTITSTLKEKNKNSIFEREIEIEYKEMNFKVTMRTQSKFSIVTARDITMIVKHANLLREEKAISDRLLSSILPPSLVKRVQNGESNISFAVQSASVLFLDVVEFTPWCASNTAATVMSTLNNFFKRLDSVLNPHPTMTKIKCIGDCYMAAGGIFAEVNQPAVHAKEVCEFGLEAIDQLLQLNQELNQNLRIRVGINTGGPLVAGVLGVGKPTFEILGPTINMAQQMEHHGVPMKVHISRATYELIYGGSFNVKERGEIEVKNGKVFTYLISP